MQRLFSTFPNSWPGAGLLLLRLATAAPLLAVAFGLPGTSGGLLISWLRIPSGLCGILLFCGLWTPAACVVQVLLEALFAVAVRGGVQMHLARAVVAASLAMLGPGALSIDAKLYGRKRIDL
jgi:uncharacterized membrane protein YphA (DoxX/SURF4 family)